MTDEMHIKRTYQLLPTLIFIAGLLTCTACSSDGGTPPNRAEMIDHPGRFETVLKQYPDSQIDGYNLYFPPAYEAHLDSSFPLIVFLQGGLGIGGRVEDLFKWELPRELRETTDINTELGQLKLNTFVYVMPHISAGEYYHSDKGLSQLLDEMAKVHRIDTDRVYLTGLSRGGYGTWGLASKMAERFAAIAPIAGAAYGVRDYDALSTLPIWAAHNLADAQVDHYRSANTIQRIEKKAGITFYPSNTIAEVDYQQHDHIFTSGSNPEFEHDAWTEVYNSVNFYKWLLRFERDADAAELVD